MIVAKWITKNGKKVYLRKGGSKNVHEDYYRVEGKGISGMHNEPLHLLDKKQAMTVAKANVRVLNFRHDVKEHGFEKAKQNKAKLRIPELQREIKHLQDERRMILKNYNKSKLDRLDAINHRLPYLHTEIENLSK